MKILLLTYRLPTDLCGGDKSTIHHMLKFLSQRHQVVLLSLIHSPEQRKQTDLVAPFCERVELIHLPRWRSYLNCSLAMLSGSPFQVAYFRCTAFRRRLQQLLATENFDVLYGYHLRSAQYLQVPQPRLSTPPLRVLDLKPVQSLNLRRMKEHFRSPVKRLLYQEECRRVVKYEPHVVESLDRCFIISETDRQALDPNSQLSNVTINPHGIDTKKFCPQPSSHKHPSSIVFCGKMDYDPNVDAAMYFCREIFPHIKKSVPQAKLFLVGSNPPSSIQYLARDSSIEVTGYVDDVRSYLNRSEVAIDPLRIGAGLQNKVLEAMASGLPMVITPIANEGIQARHGRDVLVSGSSLEFADSVVRLLEDPALRSQMGAAAREFVCESWTWEKHFLQLEEELETACRMRQVREAVAK